jgi:sugar lactone lactonase YvrE
MLINDVAVDPDTGDAYFTDSFNCRALLSLNPHAFYV